jgi:hypothetical protein
MEPEWRAFPHLAEGKQDAFEAVFNGRSGLV